MLVQWFLGIENLLLLFLLTTPFLLFAVEVVVAGAPVKSTPPPTATVNETDSVSCFESISASNSSDFDSGSLVVNPISKLVGSSVLLLVVWVLAVITVVGNAEEEGGGEFISDIVELDTVRLPEIKQTGKTLGMNRETKEQLFY